MDSKPKFKIGQKVWLTYGTRRLQGSIVSCEVNKHYGQLYHVDVIEAGPWIAHEHELSTVKFSVN
jgi:hypothetical protein